jgi:Golgi phosphoprotein 3 (GPP34)
MTRPDDLLRIADDLFLAALDDATGRLRVDEGRLGLGLAGALLAELVLSEVLAVGEHHLRISSRRVPSDALTHEISEIIATEDHDVRTWVQYLAKDAIDRVAARLQRQRREVRHHITVVSTRRLRSTAATFQPSDPSFAAWRRVRLAMIVEERGVDGWPDCVLVLLARAIGLTDFVLRDVEGDCTPYLDCLAADLARYSPLAALVDAVQTASVTSTVAHHR